MSWLSGVRILAFDGGKTQRSFCSNRNDFNDVAELCYKEWNFKEYTYKVKFKIILVNFEVNIKCIYFFYKYL